MKKKLKILLMLGIIVASSLTPSYRAFAAFDADFYDANDIMFYEPGIAIDCNNSSNATSVTSLTGSDNADKVHNFLIAKGLSAVQAAGLMGNLEQESQYSTQSASSIAWGIVQWTNGRKANLGKKIQAYDKTNGTNLYKYFGNNDKMSAEEESQLLLIELNYMYEEATTGGMYNLSIMPASVNKTGLINGKTKHWEVLTSQTTIQGATDAWLYSFERPGNWEWESSKRGGYAQARFEKYGTNDTSTTGINPECITGELNPNKLSVAKTIMELSDKGQISWMTSKVKSQVANIANGTSNGDDWGVGVNIYVLNIIAAVAKSHKIEVTSINRSEDYVPGVTSAHSSGNGSAVDIDMIDGVYFPAGPGGNGMTPWGATNITMAKMLLNIAGDYMINGRGGAKPHIGQVGSGTGYVDCGASAAIPDRFKGKFGTYPDTCHHIHISMATGSDPTLVTKQ